MENSSSQARSSPAPRRQRITASHANSDAPATASSAFPIGGIEIMRHCHRSSLARVSPALAIRIAAAAMLALLPPVSVRPAVFRITQST